MLDKLSGLNIRDRIYIGFASMILLAAAIGTVAIVKNVQVTGSIHSFEDLTGDALLASEVNSDMARTLLNTGDFISSRTQQSLAESRRFLKETGEGIEIAKGEIQEPKRAAGVARMSVLIQEYETGLNALVALYAEHDEIVKTKFDAIGPVIRKALTDINRDATDSGLFDEANSAARTNEHILLARLNVAKFLASNDPQEIQLALEGLVKARDAATEFAKNTGNAQWKASLGQVLGHIGEYSTAATRIRDLIAERNAIRDGTVSRDGNEISTLAAEVKNSAIEDEKAVARDAIDGVEGATMVIAAVVIAGLFAGVLSGWLIARGIVLPVGRITESMSVLSSGDHSHEIPDRDRKDEIGKMAVALQVFKDNMIENERLQEAQKTAEAEKRSAEEAAAAEERKRAEAEAEQGRVAKKRAETLSQLTEEFERAVKESLAVFGSTSAQMQTSAQSLTATAEETTSQASTVAAASEEASTNIQTVATATEELSASVHEISRQVNESAKVARNAVTESERANAKVQGLAEAASRIGEVVNLINDIASQTNLLALNATIEAARAGEAGKGFAVVATEVKSLADQTAKATEEIAAQIGAIQGATGEAVEAIGAIGSTIRSVDDIAGSIAAAVEEQGASTQEIATNIQQVAAGAQDVNSNISSVSQAAGDTGVAANEVLTAALQLSRQGETLRGAVDDFLEKIKAA